jgi:hypothetical protein
MSCQSIILYCCFDHAGGTPTVLCGSGWTPLLPRCALFQQGPLCYPTMRMQEWSHIDCACLPVNFYMLSLLPIPVYFCMQTWSLIV